MKTDLILLGRVGLGALLGYVVGFEREFRGSEAGDRTFALIAMGAAAFTAIGVESFPATAEKILAGVVTGVGFLGGGLIMKGDGGAVRGLTTAAAIWATASVGIVAGAGEVLLAISLTGLVPCHPRSSAHPYCRAAPGWRPLASPSSIRGRWRARRRRVRREEPSELVAVRRFPRREHASDEPADRDCRRPHAGRDETSGQFWSSDSGSESVASGVSETTVARRETGPRSGRGSPCPFAVGHGGCRHVGVAGAEAVA